MCVKFFVLLFGGVFFVFVVQVEEDESGLYGDVWYECSWNVVVMVYCKGDFELYVLLKMYYLCLVYLVEKIVGFNEMFYGLGYGCGYFDDSGNFYGVYVMGFQDLYVELEWMFGYIWKVMWGDCSGWQSGFGYIVFLMMCFDIGNYMFVFGVLFVVVVVYWNFFLEGMFVLGGKGNGNVFFFWGKWLFDC